ncbi:O-antigen ligase [Flavobacterium sp. 9AF]|uniref:O-antigen ligase family protein n=1 Tax=Flavobacterium sp. 9AF TaxID=2653142 RepID=UPI0012F15928|nr:O-antigen ligase family protein [Flavobacterium sp. 9AF]VXC31822.1 O-antigen ligase [Flavobacterium sp. 9AF]
MKNELLDKYNSTNKTYIITLFLYMLLGVLIYIFKPISVVYALLIFVIGCFVIIRNKNKNNEVLFFCAYVISAEVFLRMTKGNIGNEYGKYCVIIFSLLGIYFSGISKKAIPYAVFLLFLVPGIIYGILSLSFDANIRKALVFNLLGPICLGISSLYIVGKSFNFQQMDKLTRWMLYPIIAMVIYMFLYNPSIRDVVTGTDSNSATSGGFGPNQVSTVLGLAMFIVFVRVLFFSKNTFLLLFNIFFLLVLAYRGIITFSRGGVYTGLAMILSLLFFTYLMVSIKAKVKLGLASLSMVFFGILVFAYSISQTGGLILNRYKGEDSLGREKKSRFSGREELATTEIQMFLDNPILGVGVGKNKEYREELTGINAASHNEITRMLAEHGILGVFNLLILFFTPIVYYFTNRKYIFLFSFFIFWFLTINHAAMRIAASAFIYSLTLLNFSFDEKPIIHRE